MSNNEQEKQTLVEEGTEFAGTLRARCKVVVRGGVEGELQAPSVEITDTGTVTGTLRATSVRSYGVLAGVVEVDDICVAGRVQSDTIIRAKTLEVKLGTQEGRLEVTFGDCVLEVGEMPGDQPLDDDTIAPPLQTETDGVGLQAKDDADETDEATDDDGDDDDEADKGDDAEGGSKRAKKRRNRKHKQRERQAEGVAGATQAAEASSTTESTTEASSEAAAEAPSETATEASFETATEASSEAATAAEPAPA